MNILRYVRDRPFSIMALANIIGDVSFVGFAFQSDGWVSLPKLAGATFTIFAHVLLLAFAKEQTQIANESGALPRFVLQARLIAQHLTAYLPIRVRTFVGKKPVGVAFGMLGLNGVGLLVDAWLSSPSSGNWGMHAAQVIFGTLVIFGTTSFCIADFTQSQKRADWLLRIGAQIFTVCTFGNVLLAITSRNPFVALSILAYAVFNIATFYAKLPKAPECVPIS
jgi:hypothetical protein